MSHSCKLQAATAITFTNFHLFLSSSWSTIPLSLSPSFFLSLFLSLFQHSLLFTVQPCFCRAENLRPCALSCNLGYAKGLKRGGQGRINYFICRVWCLCYIPAERINRDDLLRYGDPSKRLEAFLKELHRRLLARNG